MLPACAKGQQQKTSNEDPLWVAIVQQAGRNARTVGLTPIGRYNAGQWDQPWPEYFDEGSIASIDSLGALSFVRPFLPPMHGTDPERRRIDAPLQWHHYSNGRTVDTLTVSELAMVRRFCTFRWELKWASGERVAVEEPDRTGVAFSRRVDPISAEFEISNLASIQDSLGLRRNVMTPTQDTYRNFKWLGFYRLENGNIIGIVNDIGYEGEWYKIISFYGGRGQVVVDVHGGGC